MILSAVFNPPIDSSYYRNNRSTRQKSLRCFPSCSSKGHIVGGFCGVPLCVTVTLPKDSHIDDLIFVSEIRPANAPKLSREPSVGKQALFGRLRSKVDKTPGANELFMGEVKEVNENWNGCDVELIFNSTLCSWDYSWKSNRWSGPHEHHVVDVIALRNSSTQDFSVASFISSSSFIVISSHKRSIIKNVPTTSNFKGALKGTEEIRNCDAEFAGGVEALVSLVNPINYAYDRVQSNKRLRLLLPEVSNRPLCNTEMRDYTAEEVNSATAENAVDLDRIVELPKR